MIGETFRQREARRRTTELVQGWRLAHPNDEPRDPYTLEDGDQRAHMIVPLACIVVILGCTALLAACIAVVIFGARQ